MWYLALETASLNVVDRMEDQFQIVPTFDTWYSRGIQASLN
jgi:hypothetical protein